MARYHVAFTTPAAAAGAAFADLRAGASDRVRVLEIGLFHTAATASTPSLERSTTLGTTSTTVVPQPGDPAEPACNAVVGTAWSAAPASTAVPMRRVGLPANIGAGIIWTFGYGDLLIPVNGSLVLMNRAAGAAGICTGYITFDE